MNQPGKWRPRWPRARGVDLGWYAVLALIGVWVFYRLGGFDLWSTVIQSNGSATRIPKTFGGVDHPFHATRADLLRRALLDGELLRWISAHQGGYPVEFYPLGAPAFEVAVWAAMFGLLPMMAAHKIAVIVVFLLPAAGFLLLARADRLSIGVGVLALVCHIAVPGWWWSGGYMELVEWGLVSSALATTLVLIFLPLSFRAIRQHSLRWGAVAGIVAACAVYTNVRSFLPLAAVAAGTVLSLAWESDRRIALRDKAILSGAIVAIAGLLAAPLLFAIVRFQDLYFFVVYQNYGSLTDYWHASIRAVSSPVFVLALIGLVAVFLMPELIAGRLVAFTLIAHVLMTLLLSGLTVGPHIEQLEAVRLMPLQRALTIYLAAMGAYALLSAIGDFVANHRVAVIDLGLLAVALVTILLYTVLDSTPIPASDRGMYPVLVTGEPFLLDQQHAVELADERAEPGTAILVLGTMLSWHDQFWSFQWSDRPFFFDDWLWYWQRDHFGEYDPEIAHAYPDPATALESAYLRVHGIGTVVVGERDLQIAVLSPLLEPIANLGAYSVFLVKEPTPIVTATGAATDSIQIENQHFSAEVSQPSSTFEVRRNWFPRWTATVDGQPATIAKDTNGYMVVTSPTPGARIELFYGVGSWDWLARALLLAGIAGAAVAIVQPRRLERILRIEPARSPKVSQDPRPKPQAPITPRVRSAHR